jgi:hypothetical protein
VVAGVRPRVEGLEGRALLSTIVVDVDSGALNVPQYDALELRPYVAGGVSFLGGVPTPGGADDQGPGGHGSWVAASAEYALQSAGLYAPVIPLVAIDATGQANPYVVADALQWVAAVARSQPGNTYVAILPLQGFLPCPPERAALRACAAAGAVVSVAAGNYGLELGTRFGADYPASYAAGDPGAIVATSLSGGTTLPSWADYGPRVVQVATPSLETAYHQPVELASSGAAGIVAGWLAAQAETTGRPAQESPAQYAAGLVWAVEASAVQTSALEGAVAYGALGIVAKPIGGGS